MALYCRGGGNYRRKFDVNRFSYAMFFWKHFFRLYPIHLLIFAIFALWNWHGGICYDWMQFVTQLLLIQSWIPSTHTLYIYNSVSWFLCDIIFFYAVFPIVYRWVMNVRIRAFACGFIVFVVAYCMVAIKVPDEIVNCTLYANPLLRLVDFIMGIMAYRVWKTHSGQLGNLFSRANMLAVNVVLLLLVYCCYVNLGVGVRCSAPFWFISPIIILSLVNSERSGDVQDRLFGSGLMQWFGGISFEIYMMHLLVMRFVRKIYPFDGSVQLDIGYFILAFVITIGVAWWINKYFVKPASNVLCRWLLHN